MDDHLIALLATKFAESELKDVTATDINQISPLILAYVGDAVYEIFIRTRLVHTVKGSVNKIHRTAIGYSRSAAQADIIHNIHELLTEKECDIVRRGRNARSGYVPKNANVTEYRYATGFEALIGYLYLNRDFERLIDILNYAVNRVEDKDKDDA